MEAIEKAKPGEIVPIYKVIDRVDGLEFFKKLSDYGRKKNSLFFEFNDKIIGSSDPCIKLKGYKEGFEIIALNNLGVKFLASLKNDFKFCKKVQYSKNKITGVLSSSKKKSNEDLRFRNKGHMDVIRKVAFKFKPTTKPIMQYGGLFGAFSYDYIECFEEIPEPKDDPVYYEFYFLDNLFLVDEATEKTYLIANALVTDKNKKKLYDDCMKKIDAMEKVLKKKMPQPKNYKDKEQKAETDTGKEEFEAIIRNIKRAMLEGDLYQAFPSRLIISNYNSEPLDIYKNLKDVKPRSYMFYINSEKPLLGTSPESCFKVEGDEEKEIEISLIAGTKPTSEDSDIDNKYEAEMKIDFKEISKHIMEIDIIRNDIAKVSELGTRHLDQIFRTEKYPREQSVVSKVKGKLKKDLDCLHAYISCMGRISGCPRIEAIKILRRLEKTKRDYFFGSVCYINPNKDFEGTIIKNAITLSDKKAHIRISTDIVYDSMPEHEFEETEKKAETFIEAIRSAGGLK